MGRGSADCCGKSLGVRLSSGAGPGVGRSELPRDLLDVFVLTKVWGGSDAVSDVATKIPNERNP